MDGIEGGLYHRRLKQKKMMTRKTKQWSVKTSKAKK